MTMPKKGKCCRFVCKCDSQHNRECNFHTRTHSYSKALKLTCRTPGSTFIFWHPDFAVCSHDLKPVASKKHAQSWKKSGMNSLPKMSALVRHWDTPHSFQFEERTTRLLANFEKLDILTVRRFQPNSIQPNSIDRVKPSVEQNTIWDAAMRTWGTSDWSKVFVDRSIGERRHWKRNRCSGTGRTGSLIINRNTVDRRLG